MFGAIVKTACWIDLPFTEPDVLLSTGSELQHWEPLVQWNGTDAAGHPILVIRINRALHECRGADILQFANAVISQMEVAIRQRSSDGSATVDQVSLQWAAPSHTAHIFFNRTHSVIRNIALHRWWWSWMRAA